MQERRQHRRLNFPVLELRQFFLNSSGSLKFPSQNRCPLISLFTRFNELLHRF